MSVVIKGLPADHSLCKCMGEYVEQAERQGDRPTFLGGRCNDMLLSFSISLGWAIRAKGDVINDMTVFLYSKGTEVLPDLVRGAWTVCEQRREPSSVRVEKFTKKRETMLKLSGGQSSRCGAYFEGVYRKQADSHDGKPMYFDGDKVIWFKEGFGWCIDFAEAIGTCNCVMHADDFAPTPDAVQTGWMVLTDSVKDPRVQVVLASAECTPSLLVQHRTPAPLMNVSIPNPAIQGKSFTAPECTPHPQALAVVGVGEGISGLYQKLKDTHDGKVMYESTRVDSNQVIFYSEAGGKRWCIGPCGSSGKMCCFISATSSAASPYTLGAV
jgi:hypothetical protein